METVFAIFALITSLCLAILVFRRKGCFAAVGATALALVVAVFALGFVGDYFKELDKWRDNRLAETAEKKAEAARVAEDKRKHAEAIAEARRQQESKDAKIQQFALKEAPKVWQVYQSLKAEIDLQSGKIEELRQTLVTFGKVPDEDSDYKRICDVRNEMIQSRDALRLKLEDAYIAAKKYEAAPSRAEYQQLHRKALDDGILEADAAEAKFKEMRLNK